MIKEVLRKELKVGNDIISFETGKMANLAGGSVVGRNNETMVLSAACVSEKPKEGIDFFPLTIDVEEKMYAAGKMPGGYIKREGRAGERAILTSRLIDRPIRPLFPKGYKNDIQIVTTVLSVEEDKEYDVLAMNTSSAALHLSQAPFLGPIGAVRVGYVDGEFIINPNKEQRDASLVNLTVAGTSDAVMMVEAGAKIVSEDVMLDAIIFGHEEIKKIVAFIEEFRVEARKLDLGREKVNFVEEEVNEEYINKSLEVIGNQVKEAIATILSENYGKRLRDGLLKDTKNAIVDEFILNNEDYVTENPEFIKVLKDSYEKTVKKEIRLLMVNEGKRIDNRALNQVRPITCELDLLPRAHGSALFTRGETQILSVVTLGATGSEQTMDDINFSEAKRYMHQYNFPGFSVGETKPLRGPGRREIGHGNLAERALVPVLPSVEESPYVIRVVSEALSSNGSTSMGSVCGSSLSLMAAGIKTASPVSGIAMGLIKEDGKVCVLTDIQGMEDHLGDMDFKVTGTKDGITALQMDIKIDGISREILKDALEDAKAGRLHIMGIMNEVITEGRDEMSKYAPKVVSFEIHPDKIRQVIGAGGKVIKQIIEETGVALNINDNGVVEISGSDPEGLDKAISIVKKICEDVEIGRTYKGKITKIMDFGCFVEVIEGVLGNKGTEGLVHISELDTKRVEKVEDVVSEGDYIMVKALEFDKMGRLKLSRKAVLNEKK